jgi:hypothetical protein
VTKAQRNNFGLAQACVILKLLAHEKTVRFCLRPSRLAKGSPMPAVALFPSAERQNRWVGGALSINVLCVALSKWGHLQIAGDLANILTVLTICVLAPRVRWSRQIFVLLSLLLTGYVWFLQPQALSILEGALERASFILAFFSALATLRHVAEISPAITRASLYLAQQPPGRRYLALATGGQIFALVLNYGAISLLGSMARSSAAQEANLEIRRIRTRRMLLAVHRGFAASLCWSPLSFATVISTAVVPGASTAHLLVPSLASGALLTGIGWGLDRILKPKLTPGSVTAMKPGSDRAKALLPVLWLLMLIVAPVVLLYSFEGLAPSSSVLLVVPLVAALWLLKMAPGAAIPHLLQHAASFCFRELPTFRDEIVLLSTAGFLGSGAGSLLAPAMASLGLDLSAVPVWVLLLLPIWLIPLGGQFGMNPILFVSLFAPFLPAPASIGISPIPMVLALTAGWAISGVTSPFTASVMLVARLGDVSAQDVSLRWNGLFALICGVVLSAWVLLWV